ncbi:helix-turn-helix transcriptional regulator [Geomicrobium sediminis]|uniref:Transcriptional regulator n=1 Tax=Geomicrobium sediminis TaxID=1347788 RepID=A0ABS2P6W7_9BACL|nr:helix-turn-helix domain-containing protein [Geomicrobium sediminis]MBM7631134.1 putative transcriptional regulator [Geomicrobium sediminis]
MKNYKLYIARKERKLRQIDIAKKLSISKQSYYKKENGLSCFTQIEMNMLAKIFNCSLDDLFWYEESNIESKLHLL